MAGKVRVAADDRFWSQVVEHDSGCWLWTGYCKPNGYGQFSYRGGKVRAHRFAYELVVGVIPDGLTIDHLCRNPPCVNPAHMEVVTLQENIARGAHYYVRDTHCPQGHAYDEANTIWEQSGGRRCRTCRNAVQRRRRRERAKPADTGPILDLDAWCESVVPHER